MDLWSVGTTVATGFAVIFYNCHRGHNRLALGGFTLVEALVAIALIAVGVASTLGALTKFNSIAAISRNGTGASAVLMNHIDLFTSMGPFNPQKDNSSPDCDGAVHRQIPKDYAAVCAGNLPTYDMTLGTHTLGYKDPSTGVSSNQWPVYREPANWEYATAAARTGATGFVATDLGRLAYERSTQTYWRLQTTAPTWVQDPSGGLIVKGTMTCTVTDISTAAMPNTYKAVFTITYNYLNHDGVSHNGFTMPPYSLSMTIVRTSDT